MASASIQFERSDIHCLHFGTGPVYVICLHGYDESSASFAFLTENLGDQYTLLAIDLPFHGATQWREERAFTSRDLVLIINKLFSILALAGNNFMLLGFSMGGRIALSLLEDIPERITRLILLAPDGITVNSWYWLATQTVAGNRLFRLLMNKPGWFLQLLQIANRLKFINKSVFRFTRSYCNDEHACNQLYHRWTCMRTFKSNPESVRNIIRKTQLPVRILYGEHDRIIHPLTARSISTGLESLCEVNIIDAGHQILQKKHALIIIKLFTS